MTKNKDFQLCADMGLSDMVKEWAQKNPGHVDRAIHIFRDFPGIRVISARDEEIRGLFEKLAFNTPGDIDKGIDRTLELAAVALEEVVRDRPRSPGDFSIDFYSGPMGVQIAAIETHSQTEREVWKYDYSNPEHKLKLSWYSREGRETPRHKWRMLDRYSSIDRRPGKTGKIPSPPPALVEAIRSRFMQELTIQTEVK